MRRIPPLTVFALMLLMAGPALARSRKGQRKYVVKRGDSCWRIAQQVFGDGKKYPLIHRYNDLGPLPHLLKPGQIIWLPGTAAGPIARVETLRRDVEERARNAADWRRAHREQGLWKLHRVSTGGQSSARIRFEDESHLRMRQNALLVIYGGASRRTALKRTIKTTVVLERGTIKGGLARMDREAGFTVRTPSSRVTLKSTLSQVEVDRLKTSIVSVYHGLANVIARGAKVVVPKDYGTYVRRGRRPARPLPLPPAPRWASDTSDAVVLVPTGQTGGFEARWAPVKRARRYRVELAEDARFNRIMVDAVVGAKIRRFRAKDLALGTYYARVASIDRFKLEGRPSAPVRVRVMRLHASRRLVPGPDGVLEAVGLLRLAPPRRSAGDVEVSVDGGPFQSAATPLRLLRPGVHRIRYRLKGHTRTSELRVRLLRVIATLSVPAKALRPGGPPGRITLTLTDERKRPASLPGLQLRTSQGARPFPLVAPGQYALDLSVPAPYPTGDLPVVAEWPGGLLAEGLVKMAPPPRETPPAVGVRKRRKPSFWWPHRPPALEWSTGVPGGSAQGARPVTYLGSTTFLADGPRTPQGRALYVRSALRGAVALLDQRLALTLDLPWFDSEVDTERSGRQDLGDLRVGVLGVVWQRYGLTLTPAFRVTAPTGGFPRVRHGTTFEPAVLFEWQYLNGITVGTNQVLAVDADPERKTALVYTAAYYATWQPIRWVSLSAELDTWIGAAGPTGLGDLRAVSAGGAVRVNLGRARLGLIAGGGLSPDARRTLGRFTAGLSLDIGFRGP